VPACCCRDIASFGRGLYTRLLPPPPEPELTPLQQQLMGCRTFKNEEIPFVDETASLKVLDTYTSQQRQTAERFTAAVAACSNFTCLQRANKLVRGWKGMGVALFAVIDEHYANAELPLCPLGKCYAMP